MKYVMGLDGGGTTTTCAIYTEAGVPVACKTIGGTNHENMEDGFNALKPILLNLIFSTLELAGAEPGQVKGAVFGMAGVDVPAQQAEVEGIVQRSGLANTLVANDSFLGIKAATPRGIGCCLVNGTGNSIAGIDAFGKQQQVAGTGLISGEEGGGNLMAAKTIRLAYDELFRKGEKSLVTPRLCRLFGIKDHSTFMQRVYEVFYGGLCSDKDVLVLLFDCANEGDRPACRLLARIGLEFAHSLAGCMELLEFGSHVDVALVGSVILKAGNPLMFETMRQALPGLSGKTHTFHPIQKNPVVGAVIWALELAQGRALTEQQYQMVLNNSPDDFFDRKNS